MLSVINKVNDRIETKLKKDSDAPYHNKTLHFTSIIDKVPDEFPTLSVVSLGEPTVTSDLTMTVQAGIWSTVEIKAFTDTTLYDATTLLDKAGDVMISMGYNLYYGQSTLSDKIPFCKVARFRRVVGSGDFLYKD